VRIEFDPAKSERNAKQRGLPFDRAHDFDWGGAVYDRDSRRDYPEQRFVALGHLGDRLHSICFTPVEGGVRIISFRKASRREVRYHAEKT
jgi:uncharacterized protein